MPSTTGYKRGDVVLVAFPFTDLSSTKRRPALVVSPDSFNDERQDLVLVALTSQIDASDSILIEPDDCVSGVLPKRSAVRVGKFFTIHSSLIVRSVATLRREKLTAVLTAIRSFFD